MSPSLDSVVRLIRPLFEHHMTIDDVIHELQPKLDTVPGMRVFLQNPPAIRIGGQSPRACISSRCRARTPISSISTRRCCEAKMSDFARPRRRHQRSADQESAGQRRGRPRQSICSGRDAAGRLKTPSTAPTASAWSRPSTPRTTNTGLFSRCRIGSRAIPTCSRSFTSTLPPANSFRSAPSRNSPRAWAR